MKRFYINHFSGMTTDSEFVEIRDQIIKENLIDPERGRNHRRVRWPDGRITDQAFSHLWAERGEAEAFLSRLRKGEKDHRWRVFEVDVEGTIDEILDPRNLRISGPPRVIAVRTEPFVDSLGEDALQIWVILGDETPKKQRTWAVVEPIHRKVHDTLLAEGVSLHPYVLFRTESEFAKQRQKVS